MGAKGNSMGMSFLDVLCSAMGGMIVLAVIFSTVKNPVPIPKLGEFLLIAVEVEGDGRTVGLLIDSPTLAPCALMEGAAGEVAARLQAVAPDGVDCWTTTAADETGANERTVFYAEIRAPEQGQWVVRPYVVDWPGEQTESTRFSSLEAWTRDGAVDFDASSGAGFTEDSPPGDQVGMAYAIVVR